MDAAELALRVKLIDGREIAVTVPAAGKVADIAERVLEAEDAPMHKMIRLIYGGRLLQPRDPIASCGIGPQVVIHAVISDAPSHLAASMASPQDAAHGATAPGQDAYRPRRGAGGDEDAAGAGAPGAARFGAGDRLRRPHARWIDDDEPLESALLKLPPMIILALLWYLLATRGEVLFSWFSKISLLILTACYISYVLPPFISRPVASFFDGVFDHFLPRHVEQERREHFHQDVSMCISVLLLSSGVSVRSRMIDLCLARIHSDDRRARKRPEHFCCWASTTRLQHLPLPRVFLPRPAGVPALSSAPCLPTPPCHWSDKTAAGWDECGCMGTSWAAGEASLPST
jgi:hypothetical protein